MLLKTAPIKILLYTDTPLYGGAEHQMYLLAKHLNTQKFEPILVCRNEEPLLPWIEKFQKLNIQTYLINSTSKNSLSNLSKLNKIIKQTKPDLIHAHIWNPLACKFVFMAAYLNNLPLVTTEHDPFRINPIKKIFKLWNLSLTSKVITVSQTNQFVMQKLYPTFRQKFTTIHNGIEPIKKISPERIKEIHKKIFNSGDPNIIIFSAGTLHPRKGFKYLISSFKKIHNQFPLARLVIAGEGPERLFLEKLIHNLDLDKHVLLLGYRNDVTDLMQASQIFVLPSIKEAFGLVILEAMAAQIPIIASHTGGIPEIINQDSGILVEPGNKNELIKAISKLIKKPELVKSLTENGLKRLQLFSAEKTANETEAIYTELLHK